MAPIVQGPEYGVAIGEIELGDGCQILTDALEVAEVHPEGLEKDTLNGEVMADGGYRSFWVPVTYLEDGVPGTLLEADNGLAAGHGKGADVDSPLFQDVGIALTEVEAVEAVELTDVQFSEGLHGVDGEGAGLGNRGRCLNGPGLGAGVDGNERLTGKVAAEGLGLAEPCLVKGGIAGALESTFLVGVGFSVSNEDDTHF